MDSDSEDSDSDSDSDSQGSLKKEENTLQGTGQTQDAYHPTTPMRTKVRDKGLDSGLKDGDLHLGAAVQGPVNITQHIMLNKCPHGGTVRGQKTWATGHLWHCFFQSARARTHTHTHKRAQLLYAISPYLEASFAPHLGVFLQGWPANLNVYMNGQVAA